MVGIHSQSLQVIGLRVNLIDELTEIKAQIQQEGVHCPHVGRSATGVPSLGDKGGYVTGPYRTPTVLDHCAMLRKHSSST